jgi:hypothetical protein
MIKKIFYRGVLVALWGMSATGACAAVLRGMQLAPQPEAAQLSLDLDESVAPTFFTLEHPYRIVIDLKHTHRAAGLHAPAPGGVVSAVRFGVQPGGTLRVVIETNTTLAPTGPMPAAARCWLELGPWSSLPVSIAPQPVHAVQAPPMKAAATSSSPWTQATAGPDPVPSATAARAVKGRDARDRARTRRAHQCGSGHARRAHA